VQRDEPAAGLEVARQQVACVLGVPPLRGGGEPDEVGKEDADDLPLGSGRGSRWREDVADRALQRRAALVAELGAGGDRVPVRADGRKLSAALGAELRAAPVLGAAARAGHTTASAPAETAVSARSSHGVARSRAKTSRASASTGAASPDRPSPISHSAWSSCTSAASGISWYSRRRAAAFRKRCSGSSPSSAR